MSEEEEEDTKFEAQWTEVRKGVNYFEMAHVLSGRLRQIDKRAKAANKRADLSQARLSEAVKVLEPFAREADVWEYYPDDEELGTMTVADLRAAKAFLATLGEDK